MAGSGPPGACRPLRGLECYFDSVGPTIDPVIGVLRVTLPARHGSRAVDGDAMDALRSAAAWVQARHPHTRASIELRSPDGRAADTHRQAEARGREREHSSGGGVLRPGTRPWITYLAPDASKLIVQLWSAGDIAARLARARAAKFARGLRPPRGVNGGSPDGYVGAAADDDAATVGGGHDGEVVPLWQRAAHAASAWPFTDADKAAGYLLRIVVVDSAAPAAPSGSPGATADDVYVLVMMPHSLCDGASGRVLANDLLRQWALALGALQRERATRGSGGYAATATGATLLRQPTPRPPMRPAAASSQWRLCFSGDSLVSYLTAPIRAWLAPRKLLEGARYALQHQSPVRLGWPPDPAVRSVRSHADTSPSFRFHSGNPTQHRTLVERCRAEGTTVGGAVLAACTFAMLSREMAMRGGIVTPPDGTVYTDPITVVCDMRASLGVDLGDIALCIGTVQADGNVQLGSTFWEVARAKRRETAKQNRLGVPHMLNLVFDADELVPFTPRVLEAGYSVDTNGYGGCAAVANVSNWGRWTYPTVYPTAVDAAAADSGGGGGASAGAGRAGDGDTDSIRMHDVWFLCGTCLQGPMTLFWSGTVGDGDGDGSGAHACYSMMSASPVVADDTADAFFADVVRLLEGQATAAGREGLTVRQYIEDTTGPRCHFAERPARDGEAGAPARPSSRAVAVAKVGIAVAAAVGAGLLLRRLWAR